MNKTENRQLAAKLARQFFQDQITFDQLVDNFPEDTNDKDIDKLFDLLEHHPKLGGLLGVSQTRFDAYRMDILNQIRKLEK